MGFLGALAGRFLSPWGLCLLAALDSSVVFFLPFGVDAVLVTLVARHPDAAWIAVATATVGSVAGGAMTFFIGRTLGDEGIRRFVSDRRLHAFRRRFARRVALSTAAAALIPPPFPFTAVLLTAGAVRAGTFEVLGGMAVSRCARFAMEAGLALAFGTAILRVMQAPAFRWVVWGFVAVAAAGTAWSAWKTWASAGRARKARVR